MKIYFDLDGPILNPKKRYWLSHFRAVTALGGTPYGDANSYWKQKQNFTPKPEILAQCKLQAGKESDYLELYAKNVENPELLKIDRLQPHARRVLSELSSSHELVAVSARACVENTNAQLEFLHLTDLFTAVLIAGVKPGTTQHVSKTKLIKVEASRTGIIGKIIIGDTDAEVETARMLGIISVVVTNGLRTKSYLKQFNPDYLIRNIKYLPEIIKKLQDNY